MFIGIAACDPNGVMGKNGKLPWHCPEDLRHFSQTIGNSPLIMGHKTYQTLPSHYFENRSTIIFSRKKHPSTQQKKFVTSLDDLEIDTAYVIGGAEIFRLFLENNLIDEFILTKLKKVYDGDTFFPLSSLNGWKKTVLRKTSEFTLYRYENPCK